MIIHDSSKRLGLYIFGSGFLSYDSVKGYFDAEGLMTRPEGVSVELSDDITTVEPGFFERFPLLQDLEIPDSVKDLGLTESSKEFLKKRRVLLRGSFDSPAEKLARELGLSFCHTGFELGRAGDYYEHGTYIVTLYLDTGGKPRIHQASFSQGSSAGHSFGTDEDLYLPRDFYWEYTPEKIADLCWGACYSAICKNQKLQSFLNKARKRRGFFIDYSRRPDPKKKAQADLK